MKRLLTLALLLTAALTGCQDGTTPTAPTQLPSMSTAASLSAYIDGPYELYSEGVYTWEAMPSGGTGSYSYDWAVRWDNDPDGEWIANGTDKTTSLDVRDYMGNFELRVVVTSGSEVVESYHYVYNMIPCTSIC